MIKIIVLLEIQSWEATLETITSLGYTVDAVFPQIGVTTGFVPDSTVLAAVRDTEGVLTVEPEGSFDLPPPDEPQ